MEKKVRKNRISVFSRKFICVIGETFVGVAEVLPSRPSIEEIARQMKSFAVEVPRGIDICFVVRVEIMKRIGTGREQETIKPPLSVRPIDGSL